MQISEEKLSKLNPVITLKIAAEDYLPKVTASLKKYSKQASIKGFRPGTVPAGIIKKMYGNSILAEELNKIIEEQLELHLKPHQDQLLGQPIPRENGNSNDIDIHASKEYEFTFEYGLRPDFSINLTGVPFEKQKIQLEKATVEKEMERMRKKFGTVTETEAIKNQEDLVYINLKELAEDKENPHQHNTIIAVQDIIEGQQANWMGKKVGDTIEANPFDIFDTQKINVAKFILNLPEEQKETVSPNFSFEITKITQHVPAEMNEEFFKKSTGLDEIKTAEDFEAHVEKEIEAYYAKQAENKLGQDIFNYLIENTKMELPIDFLKRYLKKIRKDQNNANDDIDAQFNAFSKELKWDLISSKVAKENEIKIEREEIQDEIRNQFINQLHHYGMTYYTEDMLKNFVDKSMNDRKQVQQTYEAILDHKVVETLKSTVTASEKLISEADFESDSKKRQEKMQQERENAATLFDADNKAEELEENNEEATSNSSLIGSVKNIAGKIFKGNK